MSNPRINPPPEKASSIPYFPENASAQNNQILIDNTNSNLSSILRGFTYPLQLDGKGGLSLSTNSDRIEQQIFEILDTQINERVLRVELGTNDYIFDSLSESVIESQLQRILETYIKNTQIKVKVYVDDTGICNLRIYYSYLGGLDGLVRYSFSSKEDTPYIRK